MAGAGNSARSADFVARGGACSKNTEFVLMLHGNLRCLRQEPLKRKVAVTLPEFLILL